MKNETKKGEQETAPDFQAPSLKAKDSKKWAAFWGWMKRQAPASSAVSRSEPTANEQRSGQRRDSPGAPPELAALPASRAVRSKRLKGFGGPLRVILTAIAIFIFSQVLAVIVIELLHNFWVGSFGPTAPIDQSTLLQFIFIAIAEGLAVWFVWKVIKRRGIGLSKIGLGRRPQWSDLKMASLGFLAFYALLFVISILVTALFPDLNLNQQQDVGFNQLVGPVDQLLAFVSLVLLPPLGEEILVRGYLYSGLRSKLKFVPALILTSILFGAAHFQTDGSGALVWAVAADTFLLSLVLVYLREKTGVLYAAMGVHMLNNLVAFFVHFHS